VRTPAEERLLYRGMKPQTIAEDLGVSVEHVLNLIGSGVLEAIDVGMGGRPLYRVPRESYEAFLAARKVAA